ncbi:MAG: DUF1460 domain-containing protein [Nitrospirae bacterium]|nr:DUF1460 domain-containing protein [Nitrospirota bacterium]
MKQIINTGKWTVEELDRILHESSCIEDAGARIEFISGIFLDVGYSGSTLIGDVTTPEVFVVNLAKVDCFTFIDYVEAMRHSGSFSGFMENLERVRYHADLISFENRNHFFTDWIEYNGGFVEDVTDIDGGHKAIQVIKKLNLKKDGTYVVDGIKPVERNIEYIPANALDNTVIERLKTGDYAGIYSDEEGLDVSHVGIIIRAGDKIYIRHASSRPAIRKVLDEDFIKYMAEKPGLIVLRPK